MAADAYLKAAAGDLQKAAQELHNQINTVRNDFRTFEREANRFIDHNEGERRALMARMATQTDDPQLQSALTIQLHDTERDIDRKKQELNQRRSEMNQTIAMKQAAINDLSSSASTLANKSGDPALR